MKCLIYPQNKGVANRVQTINYKDHFLSRQEGSFFPCLQSIERLNGEYIYPQEQIWGLMGEDEEKGNGA